MKVRTLTDSFHVRVQVQPEDLPEVARAGYKALVCMRPDGEAPGQPSAAAIGAAAREHGIDFHFIPARAGAVTTAHADKLAAALRQSRGPVLAYCASGNRCAVAFELATDLVS